MQRFLTRGALVVAVAVAALGLTACNKYGLTGHIDTAVPSATATTMTITGWANAADPNFKFVEDAWATVVFADKKPVKVVKNVWTSRPDVVKAVGPNSWGYETTIEGLGFGDHEICVDVVPKADVATATADSFLECKKVFAPQRESLARIDQASYDVISEQLTVKGWIYTSPYEVAAHGELFPAFYIDADGYEILLEPGLYPDVSKFLREPASTVGGVDVEGPLDPGVHTLCLGLVSATEQFPPLACTQLTV